MESYKCVWIVWVTFIMSVAANHEAEAFQVVDNNYTAQLYASYSHSGIGDPLGMTFDDTGSLYVTQRGDASQSVASGSIYKITPGGSASRWLDNLSGPRRIVWAGGTSYGDNLYVAEIGPTRDVLKIALDGTTTTLANISTAPHALALDRTGNYGSLLYTATRGTQNIYSISTTGSVSQFSSFPPQGLGGPLDLVFDPGTAFGGSLYISGGVVG